METETTVPIVNDEGDIDVPSEPRPSRGESETSYYRMDELGRKIIIPKDPNRYPGFPDLTGLSETDANMAVLNFWKVWRKQKERRKVKEKRFEEKVDRLKKQRKEQGLPLLSREELEKIVIGRMGKPENRLPPEIKTYEGCPDVSGLDEEEAQNKLWEFYSEWKKTHSKAIEADKMKRKKYIFMAAVQGEFPDDPDFPLDKPPKVRDQHPNFPEVDDMDEEQSKKAMRDYWIKWRKEEGLKLMHKKRLQAQEKKKAMFFNEGPRYPAAGKRRFDSNYMYDTKRKYQQPNFQGYGQGYSYDQGSSSSWLNYHQSGYSRSSSSRYGNDYQSEDYYGGQGYGSAVPSLPKTSSVLDSYKKSPFGVSIYEGQDVQKPLTQDDFTEIMSNINQCWMEQNVPLKIGGSEWNDNRGIVLCQDEFSRTWIKKHVEEIKLESSGKVFRAWDKDQDPGEFFKATVTLGMALHKCPDPQEVIKKALDNAAIFGHMQVADVTPNFDGGRIVHVLLDASVSRGLRSKRNKVFAGLAELEFKFYK